MSDGCVGCTQKIIEANEQKQKAIQLAKENANQNGECYGIYQDHEGWKTIPSSFIGQYPIEQHFSPQLQHANS